uniref:GRIP domain-containing protein n=1 Tax=Anopheles minimus TaxID=112268 RepID=A0A182VS19_9DIPT
MNTSQASDQDSSRKPSPFDNLSRDDLVKKCKGLLGIAQKAKQAKDECQEENRRLKEQLDHFETQKNADKECIKAMQEVADSYMDQKLQATMKVDELEKQLAKLNGQLTDERSKAEAMQAEMEQLKEKLVLLQTESGTYSVERFNELQEENSNLEKERIALEQELIKVKGSQKVLGESTSTPREEKLIRKLKLYKAKVQEINAKLLLLKSDRKILLKTVKEYSEQVPKWQKDLVNASNVLFEKIRVLELEKSDLDEKIGQHDVLQQELREQNATLERRITELTRQLENSSAADRDQTDSDGATDSKSSEEQQVEIDRLKSLIASMEADKRDELSAYERKLQTDCDEKESLRKDLETSNQTILDLKAKLRSQEDLLSESKESERRISAQLDEHVKEAENVSQKCQQLKEKLQHQIEQTEHYKQLQESLQANVSCLQNQLEESERENNRLRESVSLISTESDEKSVAIQVQLNDAIQTLRDVESEKGNLIKQIASLEAELQHQSSKLAEENQQIVQKLVVENQNLETQLAQLADKLQHNVAKSKQAVERCGLLETECESRKMELEELNSEKTRLQDEMKQVRMENETINERVSIDLKEKDEKIAELEREKESIVCKMEEFKNKLLQNDKKMTNEMQTHVQQLEEQITTANDNCDRLKTENSELLSELKEINEMLKDRGEVINLQLSKISELQDKLSRAETVEVEPLKQQIDQLQKQLTEKESELERQRDELATAMSRSNISFDAQSDVMSTSTISRVEDVARLREIDESFEEKYIKLRSLAVKLKKKVAEQSVLLQKYEKESSTPTAGADASLQTVTKNLQTLQTENDRLQDQLDGMTQETVKLREELEKKSIELTTLEQAQKDVEGTGKDRTALETAIREYQTQIQNLKREKEAFQLAKKEIDAENQRLKSSLKTKEKEQTDTVEQQKEMKSELERSKLAVKKANLLTLEMEAYERSLAELNTKLEAKKTLVKELEETIDAQERTMKSLKQQLTILEESLESQQKHSRELKQEVDVQQGKLRQSEHQRMELTGQLEELRDEQDRLKQKVENNRVELEQVAADKEKTCGSLEMEKNTLLKQNLSVENELSELRKEMTGKQQELDDIRTEFASYKIRAQSVLRQNQNKDSSREKELEEELSQLRRSLDAVENKQQALLKQISDLSKSNEELKHEKDRTQNRCKELLGLLEESRLHNESLMEESRRVNSEHLDALKTQRIQHETLVQCYKKQLEEQQETHSREIESLQKSVRNRYELSSDSVPEGRNILLNNNHLSMGSSTNRTAFTDEQRINLLLMEREDGEGSESTSMAAGSVGTWRCKLSSSSATRGRNSRDVIPLDELLNNSFDDASSVVLADGDNDPQQHGHSFGRDTSPTIELQHTKEQLIKQESRVRHLTAVLAEAEQDLAKLTQLNELLKEEVRRQQRSIEREAHVHNSEYLKNVIFKFVTLNNGDERSRLVPVLNTILKLSPEETQKLQNVAKGSDANGRGWTGLLWS